MPERDIRADVTPNPLTVDMAMAMIRMIVNKRMTNFLLSKAVRKIVCFSPGLCGIRKCILCTKYRYGYVVVMLLALHLLILLTRYLVPGTCLDTDISTMSSSSVCCTCSGQLGADVDGDVLLTVPFFRVFCKAIDVRWCGCFFLPHSVSS